MNSAPSATSRRMRESSLLRLQAVALLDLLGGAGVVLGAEADDVGADHALEGVGGVERHQLPLVDDGDAVAVLGLLHVVSGHEDGDGVLPLQLDYVVPDVLAGLGVEADGRLVEEEDVRVVEHAAGDLEAAPHAAGVGADDGVAAVPEVDDAERFFDARGVLFAGHVVDVGVEAHVLVGGEAVVEGRVLEDEADGLADGVPLGGDVVAGDSGAAGGRAHEGAEDVDGGGLAGAVRAEEAEYLALLHLEADVVDGGKGAEAFAEAGDFYGRHAFSLYIVGL